MKAVNPLFINNKTYKAGDEIPDEVFAGNPSFLKGLLERGMVSESGKSNKPVVTKPPVPETKIDFNPPKPVEIKNQNDLKKAVEETPEAKPVVETKIEQPAPKRGRASKA